jgi:ketopantoate reductase
MSKKIAVLGAGAIGSSVGADLTKAGYDVVLIDQWPAHVKAIAASGMREQFAGLGAEPVGGTPEELAMVVQRDIKKWAKVAQDAGVKAE